MALQTEGNLKIFAGSSMGALSREISQFLDVPLGRIRQEHFSDGEFFVEIGENVRGAEVFVIQSTSAPASENLMELLVTVDALKRASASQICAVVPYFGYARQDRKVAPRTPITAKLVSDLLTAAGATRVLALDLHAGQIQGFFNIPFDHLFAMPLLIPHIESSFPDGDYVVVSPDAGGVERARAFAKRLKADLAIVDKRRPDRNVAEVMNIIGNVADRHALVVDDMVDTAGTITQAAKALIEKGAKSVSVYATHPVLSGPAIDRINESHIDRLIVTNTIPLHATAQTCAKIEVLSAAPLLAKAMRRIHVGESVSSLFV